MAIDQNIERPLPWLIQRFYKTPYIGVIAFLAVFLANPISHSVSVWVRYGFSPANAGLVYLAIGAFGFALFLYGTKNDSEIRGTLLGFASGMLVWLGWASYAFKFNEMSLDLPMMAITEEKLRPANLVFLQSSVGICIATLMFFVFNKDTKCNAFRWIQKILRLDLGKPNSSQGRNICRITFLETIYVTWFCYVFSLFLGDPRFLGYEHPITYAIAILFAIWGLFLFWRLTKFNRVMAGIRYAIPTKAILWIPFGELGPQYGFYDDIWLQPQEYTLEIWLIAFAFLAIFASTAFLPQRRQTRSPTQSPSQSG